MLHGLVAVATIAGLSLPAVALLAQPAAAASGATLSQCTNGPVGPPLSAQPCVGSPGTGGAVSVAIPGINGSAKTSYNNWVNGNSNGSKSHWREGEFISYRTTISGLTGGLTVHHLVFSYDTVHGGRHAIDSLGSFDGTETTSPTPTSFGSTIIHANNNSPCQDLVNQGLMLSSSCGSTYSSSGTQLTPATPVSTTPAPAEIFTGAGGATNCGGAPGIYTGPTTSRGNIALFGPTGSSLKSATITADNVLSGTGQCTSTVDVAFTLPAGFDSSKSIVIAWGGHIASQREWGVGNSASFISGSPFHMSLLSLDGASTGSQDRALSTSAIFFTPTISTTVDLNGTPCTTAPCSISLGGTVNDSATLTGAASNASGTVTYSLFSNGTCTTPATSTQTVNVTNATVPNSANFTPTVAGSYSYQATYSGDSADVGPVTSPCEPFSVLAAQIHILKTADHSTVNAGDPIGFTVTVSNTGTGTANGVSVTDPLPAGSGSGVTWKIDTPPAAPATCAITTAGVPPVQTLACSDATLGAGGSFTVHITATTSATECSVYNNTANVTTTNDGSDQSSAGITCIPQVSQITPTGTTCAQFKSGTAGTLGPVTYATKGKTISSINPGVFFYWVKVTVSSAGPQAFFITQSTTYSPTTGTNLFALAAGSFAYDGSCNTLSTTITGGADNLKVAFNAAAPGTYFIGIKYSTRSIVGSSPATTNYLYTFSTTGVGGSNSTINLNHA